jgi:hypothetical protein
MVAVHRDPLSIRPRESSWKPSVQNLPHSLWRRKSSFWLVPARRQKVTLDVYPYDVIGRLPRRGLGERLLDARARG